MKKKVFIVMVFVSLLASPYYYHSYPSSSATIIGLRRADYENCRGGGR